MCGRYTLIAEPGEIYGRFGIPMPPSTLQFTPRYNVAPSQLMPIVDQPGHLSLMRWGLIPSWSKDETTANRMINARSETVAEKPAFRRALRTQRCLVPASGFYEWKQTSDGKMPMYFHLRDDELFAFAGLYDVWRDPKDGHEVQSYTILTTAPNELLRPVHNRMPVILKREDEERWLSPDETESDRLLPLLVPYPAGGMEGYPVSRLVNTPNHDEPQLTVPMPSP